MRFPDLAIWLVAAVFGFSPLAAAQQAPPPAEAPAPVSEGSDLSIESIEGRLRAIAESKDLDEAVKAEVTKKYNTALEWLRHAKLRNEKAAQLAQKAEEAPTSIAKLKEELAQPPADVKPEVATDATLTQLQQVLTEEEAKLASWQKTLGDVEQEPRKRAERRLVIPKELTAARQQLEEVKKQLAAGSAPDAVAELAAAAKAELEARRKALEADVRFLEQEPVSYEARAELLTLRRDQAARQVSQAEKLVKAWQQVVNQRRREEAEKQAKAAKKAQEAAIRTHPAVSQLAEKNAELAERRKELVEKIERATRQNESIGKELSDLNDQFNKIKDKESTVGLTEAIGLLLRNKRDDLPKIEDYRRRNEQRQAEMDRLTLQSIDYDELRSELAEVDAQVETVLKKMQGTISAGEKDKIESEVRSIVQATRDNLDALINDSGTYLDKLVELDTHERQIVSQTREYQAYIDERIFWVRSTAPLWGARDATAPEGTRSDLKAAIDAAGWLVTPDRWATAGRAVATDALANPVLYLLAVAALTLLMGTQPRRRRLLRELGERAKKNYVTSFVPTLQALMLTLLLALPAVLLLTFLGWRLEALSGATEFESSLGRALLSTAAVLLSLEFFRQICRNRGLGQVHFGWQQESLLLARRTLWQLIVIGVPLEFGVAVMETQSEDVWHNSLGRFFFIGVMVVLAACLRSLLHPKGAVLRNLLAKHGGGWVDRLRNVWYPVLVGMPLLLACVAAFGYYYTARQLAWRLFLTLWLCQAFLLVSALLLRWLQLTYRALAVKQARERRAAAQREAKQSEEGLEPDPTQIQPPPPEFDLSTINVQTRKLLRVTGAVIFFAGLWLVWADVLPALGFLRNVEIWPLTFQLQENMPLGSISLGDLLVALVVAVLTVVASGNLPGLLEMVVLQRLPLQAGARFAITTVARYTITIVGLVIAFHMIGIGWAKVQWLAAAMTVGLGFGLQEIFANFVSGLILLIERPIRVGDIVTVADVTGKISRIRIRATTITDWDLRELVVPNKEFVTGRIINWTLSDTLSRMSILVGVAYGSDTKQTYDLLLKVAKDHPLVLENPPPHALFDGFGDSSLNFTLRVYMASRDVYLQLRHELHVAIDNAFREAGIEIAFPQRDLHIRSIEPAVRVSDNGTSQRASGAQSSNGGTDHEAKTPAYEDA